MSDIIEWILEMDILPEEAGTMQSLVDEMVAATQTDEPNALTYEYYVNADRTTCTVIERYADNDAVLQHLGNFGAKFADRFLKTFAPVNFVVYGPANDQVRTALADFGATYSDRIAGFSR